MLLGSCLGAGLIYWCVLRLLQGSLGRLLGWEWEVKQSKEENDFQQYIRITRRDGTEDRYHNRVIDNTFADAISRGWYGFWEWLNKTL